ncbi:MAG: DUF1446 domain-containing protein [Reichenbachiella sp.]
MSERKVRIGNSSGFWGDEPMAMKRQVEKGNLDYLVADYLAEVSMSILHKQMLRKPDLGYVPDFIEHVKLAIENTDRDLPKIITNAGGKNPLACAKELKEVFKYYGIDKKVMAVTGDDLMIDLEKYASNDFKNIENGKSFKSIKEDLVVANAYTSSEGIVAALKEGADVVITGRASDSALTIGPLIYEFDWVLEDWDKIASGMVAGHVLECGSQASGGNFTDWKHIESWENMGYPIIEMFENGNFNVTKAQGTGGLINQWTIKEQLVYEIADPSNYMGPEVVSDLTNVLVEDKDQNVVFVSNVKGKPAPDTWKVSMAFSDGFKAVGSVVVGGSEVEKKAEIIRGIFWSRFEINFEKTSTNFIGYNALGKALESSNSKEILLQFSAFDHDRKKLEIFSKEIAGLILSGPQGIAAFGGRPRLQQIFSYWPTLVSKSDLTLEVFEITEGKETSVSKLNPQIHRSRYLKTEELSNNIKPEFNILEPFENSDLVNVDNLCLARSGDKGDSVNIGVLARTPASYHFLKNNLTTQIIHNWFQDLCSGEILRYEIESLSAFNFVLNETLDGGGTRSGRLDPQGKMFAATLLAQKVYVPRKLMEAQ